MIPKATVAGVLLVALAFGASSSPADTLRVPSRFKTIEEDLSAASDGDTILIAPGTYIQTGRVSVKKRITLASNYIHSRKEENIASTVIRGARSAPKQGFVVEAEGARITGLTFRGNRNHTLSIESRHAEVTRRDHSR